MIAPPKSKFDLDLSFGQVGEQKLADILQNSKIEVKFDRLAQRTGNIAVEFESRGKKSGIAITEAQWWAFVIERDNSEPSIILVPTEKLRNICAAVYGKKGAVSGGDNNTSRLVLIRKEELL